MGRLGPLDLVRAPEGLLAVGIRAEAVDGVGRQDDREPGAKGRDRRFDLVAVPQRLHCASITRSRPAKSGDTLGRSQPRSSTKPPAFAAWSSGTARTAQP